MPEDIELELDGQQDDGEENDAPPARQPKKDEELIDWQAKFNGMKGTALKQQRRADKFAADLEAANERIAALELELATTTSDLSKQLETFKQQAIEHQSNAAKLEQQLALGRLIRRDYGVLTDLFDEGLLLVEGLDGDNLTSYLSRMVEKVTGLADQKIKEKTSGSTPPPPAQNHQRQPAGETLNELRDAMQRAIVQSGINSPEYTAAYNAYVAAIKNGVK